MAGNRALRIFRPFRAGLVAAALLLAGCQRTPTFNQEIAPIVFKNCSPCHRPGEAGPFPLLTYEDVTKKAKTIESVTQARYMPPWPADPTYSHFLGERVLRNEDIQTIKQWVENGMPEGDPSKRPSPPQFHQGSVYGKPDLVVKMKEPLRIPGDNEDRFMVIKIPYEIPQDRFVRAIEFVPGNRRLIHHMNAHIVQLSLIHISEPTRLLS